MPAIAHWRGARERWRAFLLGLRHGAFCVGCCWALMLLMFVVGSANTGWMLALGAVMAAEKTCPRGAALLRGSALCSRVQEGLSLFGVPPENLTAVPGFHLSMVQRPRFSVRLFPRTKTTPGTYGFLLGDAIDPEPGNLACQLLDGTGAEPGPFALGGTSPGAFNDPRCTLARAKMETPDIRIIRITRPQRPPLRSLAVNALVLQEQAVDGDSVEVAQPAR